VVLSSTSTDSCFQGTADIPKPNSGRRSGSRRFRGNSVHHRIDGYGIRAHYGKGKVDFTITSDGRWHRHANWMAAEREIFRKLRRAHFNVEPIDNSGSILRNMFSGDDHFFGRTVVKISVPVRPIQTAAEQPTPSQPGGYQPCKEEEKDRALLGPGMSSADRKPEGALHCDTKCPVKELDEYILTLPQAVQDQLQAGDGYSYFAA
jgi:hypothetical protein